MSEFLFNQRDYLLGAAAAAAAFGALAWMLPCLRPGARLPRMAFAAAALVLLGGWWAVDRAGRAERARIENLVGALAPTYALELRHIGHEKIGPGTAADDPLLVAIRHRVDEWIAANPVVADIYTVRKLADGKRIFIVDTDTDTNGDGRIDEHETGAEIGEAFTEPDSGLDRALAGEANFNPEVVTDRWGSWVGAWAPILDAAGRVEAAVGLDYDAHAWLSAIGRARRERMLQVALVLAIVAGFSVSNGVLHASAEERRIAQEKSAASEQRLRLVLDQMPLAAVEVDPAGIIVGWNPAAAAMFGYQGPEVVGRMNYETIVAPEARPAVRELFARLIEHPLAQRSVNENLTRDGRLIRCEWFNRQIVDSAGRIVSVVCLAQDVTERHSLEEQVRQSQRMTAIGQLAAGIAHDFNNLLTVIQGHADMLREHPELPASLHPDIERIFTAGDRAANLTRQLLTFSRKHAFIAQPVDLNTATLATLHLLERTLPATIQVHADLGEDLPHVVADSSMLDQAITNLALNARDAMALGGRLTFATRLVDVSVEDARANPERRAGRFVRLSVSDTGTGITPDVLPRIFEPFFTTKDVGHGTGLGLSAVHGIVKQHGGWIEVHSMPNLGTRFELFFPPSGEIAHDTTRTRLARAASAGKDTILLVEDEAPVRHVARCALERNGYHVLDAEDGPAAERLWSRHKPLIRVLLTDMVLPSGVSGRELADRLLTERPDLPIVFISGYSIETTAPDFAASETQTFLQKPYMPEELVAAVEQVIACGPVAAAM